MRKANTPKSRREKGKRFEKWIAQEIERAGLSFAKREDGSGSGKKKGDIFSSLPFLIEAKNQESPKWFQSIDQAKHQASIGFYRADSWALILRDPRTPESSETENEVYVVLDFWRWLDLLKRFSEPKVKEPDKDFKWKLNTLKTAIKQVERYLK